jgi:hypothetical protein
VIQRAIGDKIARRANLSRASPGPSFCLAAGRGAYAIRALPDLYLGIVSGASRRLDVPHA